MITQNSQTQNQGTTNQVEKDIDITNFGKILLLMVLVNVALIQEVLWYATKDDIHLALLLLEASAAGIVLRLLIKDLNNTDQPTPPFLHFFAIGMYISISMLLMVWYLKDSSRLGHEYMLWGLLLAVQLFVAPIPIEDIISRKQNEARL